ncbi:hypothetical protein F5878DRAFT_626752 [Lentinula raphanica]|uniref:Uncharacterized protein n=1 Tax=Lentinula raphanica TaxID=153919 RepID=A0AA38P454_9AGAR|nr:hypothetical protein F5880DRAFT_1591156 [Lentinula raphanica]KAJ3835871.1 hypothetical protein F5878DRAFT_626752 [Lentinula raphanica]
MSVSSSPSLEPSSKHGQVLLENTIALIHQTASDKLELVDSGKVSLLQWAKEYAACRFRYKRIVRLLRSGGQWNEADYVQEISIAQKAIKAGDSFILARAQADWEGDWVHPRWKTAALKRAKVQKEKELEERQKLDELLSRAADISQTVDNDLQFSYESEDENFEDQLESSLRSPALKDESPRPAVSSSWIRNVSSDDLPHTSRRSEPELQAASKGSPANLSSQSPSTSRVLVSDSVTTVTPSASLSQAVLSSRERQAKPKRKTKTPLQSEKPKRARVDDGIDESSTANRIRAPSIPIDHALLPVDYRGLSKKAQRCLTRTKKVPKQRTVDEVLLELERPSGSNVINEAYLKEVSQTLPLCLQCFIKNIPCVWVTQRAQCEHCQAHELRCTFGDLYRWHRVCYQLPEYEPREIRKIYEMKLSNLDPFWFERM